MKEIKLSLSYMENHIKSNGISIHIITHSTRLYAEDNIGTLICAVPHEIIKDYLSNETNHISYNLLNKRYNRFKDSSLKLHKKWTKGTLELINNIIYLYSIKYLYQELLNKQLLPNPAVAKSN